MMPVSPTSVSPTPLYPPLAAGTRALRVVAFVDRASVPAWIAETLAAIAADDACELVAVFVAPLPAPARYAWPLEAFLKLDSMLAGGARAATAQRALRERLAEIPLHDIGAEDRAGELVIDAAALDELRELDADLLLGFGLPPPTIEARRLARHGAWFLERRASDARRSGLRYLAPLWRGEAVTQGGVHAHLGDGWHLLGAGWNATALLSFSRDRAYEWLRIPATLTRLLRTLAAGEPIARETAPAFAEPGAFAMLGFMLRLGARALRRHVPRLGRVEDWLIALRRTERALDPTRPDLAGMQVLDVPAGRFWADPYVMRRDGRDYLFVEEYPYATRRGRIAVAELDRDLRVNAVHTIVEKPWHLSYPIVFDADGDTWMTIESSAARTLGLYRSLAFPQQWEFVGDLLQGRNAVDGTLHFDGTHWYLFACISESPLNVDKRVWTDLFLFVADRLQGPWRPHPANPLVSDVRRARPAGSLFVHEGRLIRPAQDCSIDYGYAVVFHEVVTLDPQHYAERALGRIDPDWMPGLRGCHTYSYSPDAGIEVVDAKRLLPRSRVTTPSNTPESAP
jgi:hypothetical protein